MRGFYLAGLVINTMFNVVALAAPTNEFGLMISRTGTPIHHLSPSINSANQLVIDATNTDKFAGYWTLDNLVIAGGAKHRVSHNYLTIDNTSHRLEISSKKETWLASSPDYTVDFGGYLEPSSNRGFIAVLENNEYGLYTDEYVPPANTIWYPFSLVIVYNNYTLPTVSHTSTPATLETFGTQSSSLTLDTSSASTTVTLTVPPTIISSAIPPDAVNTILPVLSNSSSTATTSPIAQVNSGNAISLNGFNVFVCGIIVARLIQTTM